MSILVTGGAGFIGSNFLNTLIDSCDDEIICLDSLTYSSNLSWRPKFDIDEGLKKTIDWYEKNRD